MVLLVVSALLIAMVVTNPTTAEYIDYFKNQIKETYTGNLLAAGFTDLIGGPIINASTVRHNYVVFSVYVTRFDEETYYTYLGIFKTFIPLASKGTLP